jgi:hypothetical protein
VDGKDWGEPAFGSSLVTTCHELHVKPLRDFTIEDLRVMLGQGVDLHVLVPLALERLLERPLASGDCYPGDLLHAVLTIDPGFWAKNREARRTVKRVIGSVRRLPEDVAAAAAAFLDATEGG